MTTIELPIDGRLIRWTTNVGSDVVFHLPSGSQVDPGDLRAVAEVGVHLATIDGRMMWLLDPAEGHFVTTIPPAVRRRMGAVVANA